MEKTSHWAALYFVALMTFGNYVLFNLLVAILVEGFSSEVSVLHCRCIQHTMPFWNGFSTMTKTQKQVDNGISFCTFLSLSRLLCLHIAKRTSRTGTTWTGEKIAWGTWEFKWFNIWRLSQRHRFHQFKWQSPRLSQQMAQRWRCTKSKSEPNAKLINRFSFSSL